ncbi:hypothetical protein ARMGADRAFT_1163811 [Armillaria gallica]|uniref:F-box domain-containing protein n=1 Tax=Armillaria gallica TaxID=47427 RepID=A0A2H3DIY3_ARMGA|nr:hypothetical protein ARMGADRAFT_1163811 [Armillaria gallica]
MTGSTDQACPTCTLVADLDNYKRILSTNDFSIPDNLNPYVYGNLFPTSNICTEIEQSLGRLEEQFSCFEQVFALQQNSISQVASILKNYEEAYAKTRSEQLRVQEIMDRHKSALSSPIRSLPDDLLVVIFQLASPNAAFMDQFPWIATRVCRQWRAVAHSNPILWSEIVLDYISNFPPPSSGVSDDWREVDDWTTFAWERPAPSSGQRRGWPQKPCSRCGLLEGEGGRKHPETARPAISMRVVSQALGYSGGAPLTFSLYFQERGLRNHEVASCYLDMFIAQAARWRNVTLHLEGLSENLPLIKNGLPILESLDLYLLTYNDIHPVPTDVFSNAPSLRSLTLSLSLHSAEFIFPWKQLKELSILNCRLSQSYYLQILCNGSLLETLRLQADSWPSRRHFDDASETNLHTHRVATLPYLRVLEIRSGLSALLNSILLPKLSSLTVCGDADSVELDLSSLIERSHSVVEKLSFSSTTVAATFIRLLRVFPSLTSLSLHSPILKDKAFFYAMAQESLLPSLKDFSIHKAKISYDYMIPIIQMLAARQNCLKQFHLALTITNHHPVRSFETIRNWRRGTPYANHLRVMQSTTSEANHDVWLASSEKVRLRALSNAGMKIRIGKYKDDYQSDTNVSYVNLDAE